MAKRPPAMVGLGTGSVGSAGLWARGRRCQVKMRFQLKPPTEDTPSWGSRNWYLTVIRLLVSFIIIYWPEGLRIDGIDNGADHVGWVLSNPVEEGRQPALRHLAVRVEEGENFSCGLLSSQQAPPAQQRFGLKKKQLVIVTDWHFPASSSRSSRADNYKD